MPSLHGLKSTFALSLTGCSEWFIAKKPGSHFAVDGVEVSMKSSKSRQALTSLGLEARRLMLQST